MTNTIYQFPSDEVAQIADISISTGSVADATYGPDCLVDGNPAKVAKIDQTTGAWLFTFPAKQIVQLVALIHHTLMAGCDVKIQGHSSSDFTAPTFSAAITVPAWLGTGTRRWPVNPWLDLTTQPGYDPTGFQYWRLLVTSNDQPIQVGQVWLGETLRRLSPDIQWGAEEGSAKLAIGNRTGWGVESRYSRMTDLWRKSGDLRATDAQRATLEAHWQDTDGGTRPFLLIPHGQQNTARLVRYDGEELAFRRAYTDVNDITLRFKEVARGLRPGI